MKHVHSDGQIQYIAGGDESRSRVRTLEIVNRSDVGMVQRSKDFGFPLKPGQALGIGRERIRKHLDGDSALQVRVRRAIHLAHGARAD
jgi:hypothetical protein